MGKLSAVIGREFGERVRSRWFLLTTLFGPLLFAALTVGPPYLTYRSAKTVNVSNVVIVDATGRDFGDAVATELAGGISASGKRPQVVTAAPERTEWLVDSLRRDLMTERLSALVIFDEQAVNTGNVRLLLAGGAPMGTSERISRVTERELLRQRVADAGLDVDEAERLTRVRVNTAVERVLRDGRSSGAQVNLVFGGGVAILLYVVIVLYGQIVLRSVTEEKQSRVSELVLASVPPRILLSGKVLGIGGVALLQVGFWTASVVGILANRGRIMSALGLSASSMVLPAVSPLDAVLLLSYLVLGYALYAALFAAVGSIVSSEQEAQQAQTPVLMLLVGSVALLQPVLADPDSGLARALSTVPFSSPITMPLRLGLSAVPVREIVQSLVLLALSAGVAMIAAGRLYRTALLMYGKRPTLGEIVRWIRENG
jgi:ABC-2 type transport system permease protein